MYPSSSLPIPCFHTLHPVQHPQTKIYFLFPSFRSCLLSFIHSFSLSICRTHRCISQAVPGNFQNWQSKKTRFCMCYQGQISSRHNWQLQQKVSHKKGHFVISYSTQHLSPFLSLFFSLSLCLSAYLPPPRSFQPSVSSHHLYWGFGQLRTLSLSFSVCLPVCLSVCLSLSLSLSRARSCSLPLFPAFSSTFLLSFFLSFFLSQSRTHRHISGRAIPCPTFRADYRYQNVDDKSYLLSQPLPSLFLCVHLSLSLSPCLLLTSLPCSQPVESVGLPLSVSPSLCLSLPLSVSPSPLSFSLSLFLSLCLSLSLSLVFVSSNSFLPVFPPLPTRGWRIRRIIRLIRGLSVECAEVTSTGQRVLYKVKKVTLNCTPQHTCQNRKSANRSVRCCSKFVLFFLFEILTGF